jgi:hypothetical protein
MGRQSNRHFNLILQCLALGIVAKCQIWLSLHPYQCEVRYGNFRQQKTAHPLNALISPLGMNLSTKNN